jgi:hypothetical protein
MSNRTDHHDKIQQITAKLIELNNNFANANGLSQLDIDLLKKYVIDLYDTVIMLQPEKALEVTLEQPVAPEPEKIVEEATPTLPPEPKEEIKEVEPQIAKPVVEETVAPKPIEEPTPMENPSEVKAEKETIETPKQEIEKPVDAEEKTINDNLKQPETDDLASKLGKTPIHDLKKAISINKKFEFISQLFDGDHESYTKSVHYLNGLNDKDEAMTFFNSLKKENNWDEENKRFMEFADLVSRRFM